MLCPICFSVPGEGNIDDVIALDCNHKYCKECFNAWVDRGQRFTFFIKVLSRKLLFIPTNFSTIGTASRRRSWSCFSSFCR
mmetsp:Transcript_16969/g.20726  ORF Transcript_16969/g.20726 Transcript_16969/m.20726 type:complete len:81 (+) Transcript_16969:118-360(+)